MVVAIATVLSFFMEGQANLGPVGKDYTPHTPWKNRNLLVVSGSILCAATVMGATASMLTLHARTVGIDNSSIFL